LLSFTARRFPCIETSDLGLLFQVLGSANRSVGSQKNSLILDSLHYKSQVPQDFGFNRKMAAQQPAHNGLTLDGVRAIYGIPEEAHQSVYPKMKQKTLDLARPQRISDTYRISKMKTRYRLHKGDVLPVDECECAISPHCAHKPAGEHDCRSLAPMPKSAHDNKWQRPG
jgi:hypothetical protein